MKKNLLAGMFAASLSINSFLFVPTAEAEIQTYVGTGEYIMSDYETPAIAKERAKARALANAQEQAGVYVERHLKVSNHKVDSDVINVITKGILNVVGDVKYTQTPLKEGGGSYQIVATVRVNIDSDDIDKWFAKGGQEREKTRLTTQFETTDKDFLSTRKLEEGDKLSYEQNYDRAIDAYKEALKLNPYNHLSYFGRGRAYMNLKQYNYALSDFTKAIKLNPYHSLSYLCRGVIYRDMKQYNRALADLTKAIKLDANYAPSYLNRGATYIYINQYDNALADLTKAAELDPNNALAYYIRGYIYNGLGDTDRAEADFAKARELGYNG